MGLILGRDTRVRCKRQSVSQSLQCGEFGFDRVLFALESSLRCSQGRAEQLFVLRWIVERGEECLDHGTAETSLEEFLYLNDDGLVLDRKNAVSS